MESSLTSKTLDELEALFEEHDLSEMFEELKPHAKQAILIEQEPAEDEELPIGSSRLGGLPDLPSGQEWFRNIETGDAMNFVGQINLAEVAAVAETRLPAQGILYFFYDNDAAGDGLEPDDRHGQRVFYFDGPLEDLARVEAPGDIEVFGPTTLSFMPTIELPNLESDVADVDFNSDTWDAFEEMIDEEDLIAEHKLLGQSDNVQEGMELTCEMVARGLNRSPRKLNEEDFALTRQWHLLLQVNSNDESEMYWGVNEGCLYFWIHNDDLENKRFERSWQILQS